MGVTGHYSSRVSPFGNLRIKAYLQLPEAYRSLSRPSSAISAMASTLRSCSLDLALIVYLFLRLLRKVHNPLCLFFPSHISITLDTRRLEFDFTFTSLCLSFFISLCSFQGALKFRTSALCFSAFRFFRSFKTIQRSIKISQSVRAIAGFFGLSTRILSVPLWLSPLLFSYILADARPWNPFGLISSELVSLERR